MNHDDSPTRFVKATILSETNEDYVISFDGGAPKGVPRKHVTVVRRYFDSVDLTIPLWLARHLGLVTRTQG